MKIQPSSSPLVPQCREALERLVKITADAGVTVQPYGPNGPEHFAALPPEQQAQVLADLLPYVEVCEAVHKKGETIANDGVFVWRMIRRLGLRLKSDAMDLIHEGDVLEIYNSRMVQIFRNLRFFEVCSYSVDDVLCRPFYDLYQRDDEITAELLAAAMQMLGGKLTVTMRHTVGRHEQSERGGKRLKWLIEPIVASPLFDASNQVVGIFNLVRPVKQLA